MVFSSLLFLYIFLPLSVLFYFAMPTLTAKNRCLTVISLLFYAFGEPVWVLLLLISSLVDYICSHRISRQQSKGKSGKDGLIASIIINLGFLCAFKYINLFLSSVNLLFSANLPLSSLTLPIGISFFTFQTMSYTIDVYRKEIKPQQSFLNFLLFVSLFPQLVAGPIVRYAEIETQLTERKTTLTGAFWGVSKFCVGLGKKVLLANTAGSLAKGILDADFVGVAGLDALFGLLMFAFQIYFDFSGYSDMAIGLGALFGFTYRNNFNYPYISQSITEFWRRWHITLGSFFRDYVYIPMGGNRKHQLLNLFVVWGLTGFWHGAEWNFLLWGLYYFLLLVIEKYILKPILPKIKSWLKLCATFFFVLLGWALFYYSDMSRLGEFLKTFFCKNGLWSGQTSAHWLVNLPIVLVLVFASLPVAKNIKIPEKYQPIFAGILGLLLLLLSTFMLTGQSYNPFLYFRF